MLNLSVNSPPPYDLFEALRVQAAQVNRGVSTDLRISRCLMRIMNLIHGSIIADGNVHKESPLSAILSYHQESRAYQMYETLGDLILHVIILEYLHKHRTLPANLFPVSQNM